MTRTDDLLKVVSSRITPKWKRRIALVASGLAIIGLSFALRAVTSDKSAEAQLPNPFRGKPSQEQPAASQQSGTADNAEMPRHERPKHDVMAVVNGQDIRREALASACVERFGEEVLEGLVNKRLIMHHCRNRQVEVTDADIDAEIDRMAARFKIGREQWLQMLEKERGINIQQYKRDILWPTLALRKCAAEQLTVSDEELQRAYESQFGPAVKCRLIVVNDRNQAEQIRRQVIDQPADFARLAMQHSQDVNSASIGGLIQPIRHNVGDPNIEKEVFAMQPNAISSIIPVGQQFAILKCEGHEAARNVPLEDVRSNLIEQIQEGKLREVASALFKELQESATIQNVWNDPQLRAQNPGVVATINGEPIRYEELAEECLLRYGEGVLDVEISHLLLQQALVKANLSVTDQDLNEEIGHAAKLSGIVDKNGQPDLEKWIQMATEEQGVEKEEYLRDSVWPSAALKKLTGGAIEVTQEDIQKGYEANYSERVRCRAIVLGNMRRAQEVWGKARQNTSMDYFGDLAEEYSIEPTSKSLRGEVPPIQRFGGQPQLEEVAFELQPGELSGIIQLADKFVILKCEGRTEPVKVNMQEVQQILYEDIFEKKLRMAMNERFEEIRSRARIDNYLAGTSQAPERVKPDAAAEPRVDSAVRPTSGTPTPTR
ncbi:MAG: peptidylprolyl isomerase [Planctomycetes bacterium]|nr:peptidylprolyl isomerase [Planctomycetota bacterium]